MTAEEILDEVLKLDNSLDWIRSQGDYVILRNHVGVRFDAVTLSNMTPQDVLDRVKFRMLWSKPFYVA